MNTKLRREAREMEFKSYDIEKKMLEGRKIIVSKESKFKSANRLVTKFHNEHPNLQFNTFFKMYMLQSYRVEKDLYRGSGLQILSIRSYMSMIKSATNNIPVTGKYRSGTTDTIFDFIQNIKSIISPFKYYSELERDNRSYASAYDLVNTDYITDVEKDFILSDLYEVKAITNEVRKRNQVIQKPVEDSFNFISKVEQKPEVTKENKEKEMKTKKPEKRQKSTIAETRSLYELILSSWDLKTTHKQEQERLCSIVKSKLNRDINPQQLYKVLNSTKRFLNGDKIKISGTLFESINQFKVKKSKEASLNKKRIQTSPRIDANPKVIFTPEQSQKEAEILVRNPSCGVVYLTDLIQKEIGICHTPNTIKRYKGFLTALSKGETGDKLRGCPEILRTEYAKYIQEQTDLLKGLTDKKEPQKSELEVTLQEASPELLQVVKATQNTGKQFIKQKVEEGLVEKYILVKEDKILCSHSNKCFIEGFLECGGKAYKDQCSIYKVSEVVM